MLVETQAELRKPFDKSEIKHITKGGASLAYVGHACTTDRLLQVDPGWSWEPVAFNAEGLPKYDDIGGLWIRLTVAGVTRYGYGDANGKKGPNAVKEIIGDAIRNAAMRFGVALDLWGANYKALGYEPDERPFTASSNVPHVASLAAEDAAVDDILESVSAAASKEDLKEIWTRYVTAVKSERIASPESINLIKFEWTKRKDQLMVNENAEPVAQPENGAGGDKLWPDTTKVPAAGLHP